MAVDSDEIKTRHSKHLIGGIFRESAFQVEPELAVNLAGLDVMVCMRFHTRGDADENLLTDA